ncbi:MAG: hypothetical protein NTV06_01165, partial [candidate division Zixibacteria bacterium]|nr:hypothetical protein [candidate division Zixibacteria bacterium]
LLQTRTTNYIDSSGVQVPAALVSGVAEYDARGRLVKSYKPFYDLLSPRGVTDYSPWNSVISEIRNYYNGTNAANCDTIPYSRNIYYNDIKGRLKYAIGPGSVYSDTGKGAEYQYAVVPSSNLIVNTVYDQDNNKTVTKADKWGLKSWNIAYYTNSQGNADSTVMVTNRNTRGLAESVGLDSAGTFFTLRPMSIKRLFPAPAIRDVSFRPSINGITITFPVRPAILPMEDLSKFKIMILHTIVGITMIPSI